MTASEKLRARIAGMSTDTIKQLYDQTGEQMRQIRSNDPGTYQALAIVREFIQDELDRRDPEFVDAFIDSGHVNMATYTR